METDWNTLYRVVTPGTYDCAQLAVLVTKFNPIPITQVDPDFERFLKLRIQWDDVIDTLKRFYSNTSGEFFMKDARHVVLFIPNASTFFHIVRYTGEKVVMTINTKEERKTIGASERQQICRLATTLSYYIWKQSK